MLEYLCYYIAETKDYLIPKEHEDKESTLTKQYTSSDSYRRGDERRKVCVLCPTIPIIVGELSTEAYKVIHMVIKQYIS